MKCEDIEDENQKLLRQIKEQQRTQLKLQDQLAEVKDRETKLKEQLDQVGCIVSLYNKLNYFQFISTFLKREYNINYRNS